MNSKSDAIPQPNHTTRACTQHTRSAKYVVHHTNATSVTEKLLSSQTSHRVHCFSPIRLEPRHMSEYLELNMKVKTMISNCIYIYYILHLTG